MSKYKSKIECERCGTCCLKGGPALHFDDRKILDQKFIDQESLITIRKGEPVFSPDKKKPECAETEIIKLKGKQTKWSCTFYDQDKHSCSIYEHRPLECLLLKCWDTEDLEAIAGEKLLSRFDIISEDAPVIEYILQHENKCSLEVLAQMNIHQNSDFDKNTLAELADLVNKDLAMRYEAVNHLNINLELELFYFGRPLFKILSQFGLSPKEANGKVILIQA